MRRTPSVVLPVVWTGSRVAPGSAPPDRQPGGVTSVIHVIRYVTLATRPQSYLGRCYGHT